MPHARTHLQVRLLSPEGEAAASTGQITNLLLSPDGKTVAAGYSSGVTLLFSLHTGATAVTLHGHRSAVTAGRYHSSGALLASGSADTDIVIWDTVAESGLYRLKGHRDGVTDVVFLEGGSRPSGGEGSKLRNGLASCSKDTLVKLWDLDTQSCVQTVVGHRGEVRCAAVFRGFNATVLIHAGKTVICFHMEIVEIILQYYRCRYNLIFLFCFEELPSRHYWCIRNSFLIKR